jgi:beta-glucosidase
MTAGLPQVLEAEAAPGPFPPQLRFGAATAAYQIEGATHADGRGESIWDVFCRVPGAVDGGDDGDVACDHYHRWASDLDLMAALGIESYRFSIAWPRIQPDGRGVPNPAGLAFYRRIVEGLLERGIEPIATLYHWDLPQALQAGGGWAARETAERFGDYAQIMAAELGDVVSQWITHNEPWVVAFLGHAEGRKAPGVRDWPTALRASHHLLLSHGLAAQALRANARTAPQLGISLNLVPLDPATPAAEDLDAVRRMDGHQNRWFLDPLLRGAYPEDMLELYAQHYGPLDAVRNGDLETIGEPLDFLGINYYTPQRMAADPAALPLGVRGEPPLPPLTTMGWEVDADGLRRLLVRVLRDYGPMPIYITENGASFEDGPPVDGVVADDARVEYLRGHLSALAGAVIEGVDVRRYCVWSLMDNFEWEHGYSKRFGIVHVDYDTQQRTPKRSGLWYRDFIAQARNGGPS